MLRTIEFRRAPLAFLAALSVVTVQITGCEGGKKTLNTPSASEDGLGDYDSPDDDDDSHESDDDSSADDDTLDDDDTGDDDTVEIPCSNGFRVPEGFATAGGCITQVAGGVPGAYGTSIQVSPDGTRHIATTKGRDIVVLSKPPDDATTPKESSPNDYGWLEEIIAHMGEDPELAIDQDGVRHLVWHEMWSGLLMYADDAEGAWDIQVLDDRGDVGVEPAIDIDEDDHVHIVYKDAANMQLEYMTNKTGSWTRETAWGIESSPDAEDDAGVCNDIAVDLDGHVYLLTIGVRNYVTYQTLRSNTSNGWQSEWENSAFHCGSLDLDSQDRVHVGVYLSGSLIYATDSLGDWDLEYVDGGAYFPEILVDKNDIPHIIYQFYGNGSETILRHSFFDVDDWQYEDIASGTHAFPDSYSVAEDSNNSLHVAWYDGGEWRAKYSHEGIAGWETEPIISSSNYTRSKAVSIDTNDNVVLAYRGDKGIYLATSAENAWHSSLIVETDNSPTFNPDALKFDEEGYAHFIYRREIDEIEQIVYGTNRSGMWRFETLPTNADEDINSVVFDVGASGEIFIAYGNYQNIHLFQKMGMEWVSEIIAENVKFCRSLALTETGDPAIVYTNDGVFFAERRHGEWKISPVDESDNVAVGSLKILSPDLVYIAYWDTDEQQLRFATRDADTWVIENIQETKGTAREAVMDVDDQGIPHIYYSSTNPNFRPQVIRYATKQDGQWYVDNDENAAIDLDGVRLGFAIDREGTHHVIYTSRFGILLLDTDPPKLAN